MSAWTSDELDRVGAAEELELTVGSRTVTIWVGRVGDDLYVRSWRGAGGFWFRATQRAHTARIHAGGVERDVDLVDPEESVNDLVDDAYRTKYARYLSSYTAQMVAPAAHSTTLVLEPR
jgi:hypothetical protein